MTKVSAALRIALVTLAIACVTALLRLTGFANHTTVALAYLLLILPVAAFWGLMEATIASILATLCFNFFFLPPTGTFTIAERENWIALSAFLVVSIAASQISERVRRRGSESSLRFRATLLDALAHDLKTPLTSLKAASSSLRAGTSAPVPQQEMVSIIEEETDRLDRIVSEILRMASADAGKLRLDREDLAVRPLLQRIADDARKNAILRDIRVIAEDSLPLVRGDRDLVATVLHHLIENADKYSTRGKPIVLSAELYNGEVRVSVSDEGPGLTEEELAHIFEPQYRTPSARKLSPGSGMGLAIARDIIAAHGGKMWAESARLRGSRFFLTLPTPL